MERQETAWTNSRPNTGASRQTIPSLNQVSDKEWQRIAFQFKNELIHLLQNNEDITFLNNHDFVIVDESSHLDESATLVERDPEVNQDLCKLLKESEGKFFVKKTDLLRALLFERQEVKQLVKIEKEEYKRELKQVLETTLQDQKREQQKEMERLNDQHRKLTNQIQKVSSLAQKANKKDQRYQQSSKEFLTQSDTENQSKRPIKFQTYFNESNNDFGNACNSINYDDIDNDVRDVEELRSELENVLLVVRSDDTEEVKDVKKRFLKAVKNEKQKYEEAINAIKDKHESNVQSSEIQYKEISPTSDKYYNNGQDFQKSQQQRAYRKEIQENHIDESYVQDTQSKIPFSQRSKQNSQKQEVNSNSQSQENFYNGGVLSNGQQLMGDSNANSRNQENFHHNNGDVLFNNQQIMDDSNDGNMDKILQQKQKYSKNAAINGTNSGDEFGSQDWEDFSDGMNTERLDQQQDKLYQDVTEQYKKRLKILKNQFQRSFVQNLNNNNINVNAQRNLKEDVTHQEISEGGEIQYKTYNIQSDNYEKVLQAIQNQKDEQQKEIQSLKDEVMKVLERENEEKRKEIQVLRETHAKEIRDLKMEFQLLLFQQNGQFNEQLQQLIREQIAQMYQTGTIQNAKAESTKQMEELREEQQDKLEFQKHDFSTKLAELKEDYDNKIYALRNEIQGGGNNYIVPENYNGYYVQNGVVQTTNGFGDKQQDNLIDWDNWENENGIVESGNDNVKRRTFQLHDDAQYGQQHVQMKNVYESGDDGKGVQNGRKPNNQIHPASLSVINNKNSEMDSTRNEVQEWKELTLAQFLDRAKKGEVSFVLLNLDYVQQQLITVTFQTDLDMHHVIVRAAPQSSKKLYFGSEYDVSISNCSFQGVSVEIRGGEHAVLSDVEFSLKSRRKCLYVSNRKQLELYRVTVLEGDNSGCSFHACDYVKLNNVRITRCLTGIEVAHSKVSMEECYVGDCGYGVSLHVHSEVVYDKDSMFERIVRRPWDKDGTSTYRPKNEKPNLQQLSQEKADKIKWNFL